MDRGESYFVESLLKKLTLREKVEQTIVTAMKKGKTVNGCPGAAFFFGEIITEADEAGIEELRGHVSKLIAQCKIPPLITSDFENGCGSMVKALTTLPVMMGLGATNDLKLAYDYGKATALEARSVGANWTFSPVGDLNINNRNPLVNVRSLTDDADYMCDMLSEVIKGMQENGLSACVKHFPGDGVDYRDQHMMTTENTLPMAEWYETFGKVYKAAIAAGLDTIMAGHISLPEYPQELDPRYQRALPATLSKELITDLLKDKLGFEGIVVTDALDMMGFHGWYDTHEEAELASFASGCDMMLWPSANYADNLEKAIRSGNIPAERLEDAVRRILRVKYKLGLFNDAYRCFTDLTNEEKIFVKEVQKKCCEKSITLIRDNGNHFPLSVEKTPKVGIIVITEYLPSKAEAIALREEFENRGFAVEYFDKDRFNEKEKEREQFYNRNDIIIYAMFFSPHKPIGFLDYYGNKAAQIASALKPDYSVNKCIFVSFGSPYYGEQYFERGLTYVNAYSPFDCVARAFVRAACGEYAFEGKTPVKLRF